MKFLPPKAYQLAASRAFRALSRQIKARLPDARIAHIGSSSIKGLWSKGDLDIYVGVPRTRFDAAIKTLKKLGFIEKRGTLRNRSLWPFIGTGYPVDVGIQLVATGSKFEFFLTFRKLLRKSPKLKTEYNHLKLASRHLSETAYRRKKSRFITSVLFQK